MLFFNPLAAQAAIKALEFKLLFRA